MSETIWMAIIVGLACFGLVVLAVVVSVIVAESVDNARRKKEQKRRCSKCGTAYKAFTDTYCRHCGAKLK